MISFSQLPERATATRGRVPLVVLYMRSLLLVESFDYFRPSNQYILVRVLFTFCENVIVPAKSPVKVYPKILDIFFLGELHIVYMDWGACFSSCSECYVDRLEFVGYGSPFFKPVLNCK
jgi:hypothetical protein